MLPGQAQWDGVEAGILVGADRCATSPPRAPITPIALACAGQTRAARSAADSMVAQVERGEYVFPIILAATFVGLGDHESALHWFVRSIDERAYAMVYAREDPIWDSLRGDPRFTEQLERIRPAEH